LTVRQPKTVLADASNTTRAKPGKLGNPQRHAGHPPAQHKRSAKHLHFSIDNQSHERRSDSLRAPATRVPVKRQPDANKGPYDPRFGAPQSSKIYKRSE
jgi:hypothetical protein